MSLIQELKNKLNEAKKRFYSLKTKRAKEKQRDIIRDLNFQLEDALLEGLKPYLNMRHEGVIVSGGTDALARTEFGIVPVYAVNDRLSKSWYDTTCCVSYKDGDKITFEIKHPNVENGRLNWFAAEVEGGSLDTEKYNKLCKQDNLAFFKKQDGSMTGLFK
jgi:hypothetical protein